MSLKKPLQKSKELYEKAKKIIPSCSQTFSKSPSQFVQGVSPVYLKKGLGSHVWDVDGNEYIDFLMALCPVILGYSYEVVNDAIIKQLKDGISFSLPHPLEVEVAEKLIELIPCAEMVRYGKNGSDVTSAAVRVARAYTKKDKIAVCGYHGWQDWYIGTTTRDAGIPKETKKYTIPFEYNNIESLKKIYEENPDEIAAVIMEPISTIEPENNFLQKVQNVTHKNNALLVFDEIVTGFRMHIGGAQSLYKVTPDLATFGKAMANGMPISAIVGKKDIMELFDEVFFSFTFGGETLSLAATLATINEIIEKKVIDYVWKKGQIIIDEFKNMIKENSLEKNVDVVGLPPHSVITFKDDRGEDSMELRSLYQQEIIKNNILTITIHNLCYSHSNEDINKLLEVYRNLTKLLKKAIDEKNIMKYIEGTLVSPVFRKASY